MTTQRSVETYADVAFRAGEQPGARYTSGLTVYDEALVDGMLAGRYWSTTGSIKPELMHVRRDAPARRPLPAAAFGLRLDEAHLDRNWRWTGQRDGSDPDGLRHAVVELAHAAYPVGLEVHTRLFGDGFFERWLVVANRAEHPVGLVEAYPWTTLAWVTRDHAELVAPGQAVFSVGYYERMVWGEEGAFVWEGLLPGTRTIQGRLGRSGHGRPMFILRNDGSGECFVVELAWSGNWSMDFRVEQDTQLPARTGEPRPQEARVSFRIGPFAADPVQRVVAPGESVATPSVHLAQLRVDPAELTWRLHRHVRRHVLPAQIPGKAQRVEANHRGYICDHEDEPGIRREIDIAADLGCELFVVDAGWFGHGDNQWGKAVGDWQAGPWLPNDLDPIVEHAHQRGMLFGLWGEIESIGADSRLRREHPEWVMTRDGGPVAGGRALDVANPAVAAWMEREIERLIARYGLDLFRLDYNTRVFEGGNRHHAGYVENTLWRHVEALYGMFGRLRGKFPGVIFENCASGGGRLDLGILRFFQITEVSDWGRAPRTVKMVNGLTRTLPPEICLRVFGTEIRDQPLYGDLDFQLRAMMLGHPIVRGVYPSLEEANPILRATIRRALATYKERIRPLLPDCRVFHHTPDLPLLAPSPWCVLEYAADDRERAAVWVFRLTAPDEGDYRLRPRGLDLARRYRVRLDGADAELSASGLELARDGLPIRLTTPLTSELIFCDAL